VSIDLNNGYNDLRPHIGHKITCVCYGAGGQDPDNIALECEDCGMVLIDFNHSDEEDGKEEEEMVACPACGGPGALLGQLGNLVHYRCRDCGIDFYPSVVIPAEAHSDCDRIEIEFDALHWFESATDAEIIALAECGWGADRPADVVAEHFSDDVLKPLFDFMAVEGLTMPDNDDPVGYEVHVNEYAAMVWLRKHRPAIVDKIATTLASRW